MQAGLILARNLRPIGRRWRAISPRRRVVLGLIAAVMAWWGLIRVHEWWTGWPARLVLRVDGEHFPIAFSPDGATLATRSFRGAGILLWDAATGRRRASWPGGSKQMRFAGAFSPDGKTFASNTHVPSSGANFSVDLIDVATGEVRSTFQAPLAGYLELRFLDGGRTIRLVTVGISPGSPTAKTDRMMTDVEVATGRHLSTRTLSCPTTLGIVAVSNDGRLLALTDPAVAGSPFLFINLTLWDLDTDREVGKFPDIAGQVTSSRAMAFSPDDRSLAVGLDDGSIAVFDVATRRLRSTFSAHGGNFSPMMLNFSPDGSTISSLGHITNRKPSVDLVRMYAAHFFNDPDHATQYEIVLLDAATGRRKAYSRWDILAVFSSDGRTVASGHVDGAVRIRDVPE